MHVSSKKTPCPSCGRSRTNHCRFDIDSTNPVVFCHQGVSSGPPAHLRIGQTIQFANVTWALVGIGKGHSGNSHEFRPHRDNPQFRSTHRPPSAQDLQMVQARRSLAIHAIDRFFEKFQQVWNITDFHSLQPSELHQAFDLIYATEQEGLALARSIQTVWRENHDLRDRHKARFDSYIRNLKFQREDVDHFRQFYLGEVI
jgi:hypothetical protein